MKRHNHFLWVGPVLTFVGMVSYFLFFVRFPVLRDFPWINLPLVLGGVGLSLLGGWQVWRWKSRLWVRLLGMVGTVFSLAVGGMFCWYVFYHSFTLPPPQELTVSLKTAPDFELLDQQGRHTRLSDFQGAKVVLVFYRGFW